MTQATAQAAISGRSRDGIAQRLAADLRDGYVVNLGVGIPLLIPRYIPADVEVILHAENGVLGLGPLAAPGHEDPDLTDAGKQPVTLITGAAIVDSAMSFAVVRGGHAGRDRARRPRAGLGPWRTGELVRAGQEPRRSARAMDWLRVRASVWYVEDFHPEG